MAGRTLPPSDLSPQGQSGRGAERRPAVGRRLHLGQKQSQRELRGPPRASSQVGGHQHPACKSPFPAPAAKGLDSNKGSGLESLPSRSPERGRSS